MAVCFCESQQDVVGVDAAGETFPAAAVICFSPQCRRRLQRLLHLDNGFQTSLSHTKPWTRGKFPLRMNVMGDVRRPAKHLLPNLSVSKSSGQRSQVLSLGLVGASVPIRVSQLRLLLSGDAFTPHILQLLLLLPPDAAHLGL